MQAGRARMLLGPLGCGPALPCCPALLGPAGAGWEAAGMHSPSLKKTHFTFPQGSNSNYRMMLLTTANPAMADLVPSPAAACLSLPGRSCVLGPPWQGWRWSAASSCNCRCSPANEDGQSI